MTTLILIIQFDSDDDPTDLSAEVISAEIEAGLCADDSPMGGGRARIVLGNADGRFSPENLSSPFYGRLNPNRPIALSARVGTTTYPLFTGVTERWLPESGGYGRRTCTLIAGDLMGTLDRAGVSLPLRRDEAGGALIRHILNLALDAPAAIGTVSFSAAPTDGDTITVNGVTYTFRTALTPSTPAELLIGADAEDSADALADAINGAEGVGTRYTAGTPRPEIVTAAARGTYFRRLRESGAIRYYRLGVFPAGAALDSGVNGRDGLVTGGALTVISGALGGDPDGAGYFDGSGEHIAIPTLDLAHRSFTISAWLKPDAAPPAAQDWFSAVSAGAFRQALSLRLYDDGALGVLYWDDDAFSAAGVLPFGVWSHLACVYDHSAGQTRLYRNGEIVYAGTVGGFEGANAALRIGSGAGGNGWQGGIDEVAIHLRPLSGEEISDLVGAAGEGRGVTLRAALPGAVGNAIPLGKSGTAISLSGATLAGGEDRPADAQIDAGRWAFDVAGDGWTREATSARAALRAVTESAQGLAWVGREGMFVWRDGEFLLRAAAATPTLTIGGELTLRGERGAVVNAVRVTTTPRATQGTGVVARADSVIAVPGGSGYRRYDPNDPLIVNPGGAARTVILPFRDPLTGETAGAEGVILPLEAGIDWTANDRPDGSGIDYTYFEALTFSVALTAGEAAVTIRNTALGVLYVTFLQLRGRLITRYAPLTFAADDPASAAAYGLHAERLFLPLPAPPAFAASLAEYRLARGALPHYRVTTPSGNVESVGGVSLYAPEIGEVIAVSEPHTGVSGAKYLLAGVVYRFGLRDAPRITYHVRRLDDQTYGVFDDALYGRFDETLRAAV